MSGPAAAMLASANRRLTLADVEDPAGDAARLLAFAAEGRCGCALPRDCCVSADGVRERFDTAVEQRAVRRPVSQITGKREFYGRRFHVDSSVLDPRPESELIVEQAASLHPSRVLDLGTGSGCLLISILLECPAASGTGADCSAAALEVAKRNAKRLGVQGRAEFARSDWLESVSGEYDLIVSNPPYVSAAEHARLQPEIRYWEPREALTPGGDGTSGYRSIARGAFRHLAPGGRLALEIAPGLLAQVIRIFERAGYRLEKVLKDLAGLDRVVILRH